MKSHDLARKLLELPNDELYYEKTEFDGLQHKKTSVKLTDEITRTPAGLFVGGVEDLYALSPQDLPVLGHYRIHFKGDIITGDDGERRHQKKHISHLSKGTIDDSCTFFRMYPSQNIMLVTHEDYFNNPPRAKNSKEFTVDDITEILVLVYFDPDTWTPTYKSMTYQEAIDFSTKFDGVNVFRMNLEETLEFMKTL